MDDDISLTSVSPLEKERGKSSLEDDKQLREFRKDFFESLLLLLKIGFFMSFAFAMIVAVAVHTTQSTVIAVTLLMIPTVLTLALIRFIYSGTKKDEKTPPSVTFNILKEIIELIISYIDKK